MRPRDRKIGSKVKILCPECDGEGTVEGKKCVDCNGTGYIEGIITKQ
jgi:DnaJ-class molecular chaperone